MLLSNALFCVSATLLPQIPDGAIVVSTFQDSFGPISGSGGLFLVDPRVPGPPVTVSGLGTDLTGPSPFGDAQGANSVAVRDDGTLLVGERGPFVTPSIDLHEILIQDGVVVSDTLRPLGAVDPFGFGGAIEDIATLPRGDAVVAVRGLMAAPPLNGAPLAIVTSAGAVQPLVVNGLSGTFPNALAVDPSGQTGYVAMANPFDFSTDLYSFPLPAGGTANFIATVVGVSALAVDSSGQLVASLLQSGVHAIDVATGAVTAIAAPGVTNSAVAVERATDRPVYALAGDSSAGREVGWIDATLTPRILTNALTGIASDLTVMPCPRRYGNSTPGNVEYRWDVAPGVGGLPRLGNTNFGVRLRAIGGQPAGCVLASAGPVSQSVFGVDLLVDPATAFGIGMVPPSGVMHLPIPSTSTVGLSLCLQSFHLDSGAPQGVAASDGLRITVLQ